MGPSKEGIEAMAKVGPLGRRYRPQGDNLDFEALLLSTENVKPGYVNGYPGSSIRWRTAPRHSLRPRGAGLWEVRGGELCG